MEKKAEEEGGEEEGEGEEESNPFAHDAALQCNYLVVDSGGFINLTSLEKMAKHIITLPEVIFKSALYLDDNALNLDDSALYRDDSALYLDDKLVTYLFL